MYSERCSSMITSAHAQISSAGMASSFRETRFFGESTMAASIKTRQTASQIHSALLMLR